MTIKLDKDQNKSLQKRAYNKANSGSTGYKKTILASQLDEAFKRFNEKFTFDYEPKKGDLGWHPSGDCLPPVSRLWGYAYFAVNGEFHPSVTNATAKKDLNHLNKTFMVGHYWHQVIQYLIQKEGWAAPEAIEGIGYRAWDSQGDYRFIVASNDPTGDAIVQGTVQPFHYVRGQGDVAPLIMPNWTGLVDIKTMNPADYKAGLSQSRFANKYLAQINIYMDLFNLDQALILAVDKGSAQFAEYTFVRDQILIDQIYAKWERVSYLLDHDIIPTEADDKLFELYIGDE